MRTIHAFALASALFTSCSNGETTTTVTPPAAEAPAARPSRFAVPIDGLPVFGPDDAVVTISVWNSAPTANNGSSPIMTN